MKAQHNHQHNNHAHMVEDFRKKFWLSLFLTIPILILSPMIQEFAGLGEKLRFAGDQYLLWAISSIIFFYSAAVVLGLSGIVIQCGCHSLSCGRS